MPRRGNERGSVAVVQTSPISRLPYELFLEVFSHFPVLRWTEMYARYHSDDTWSRPIPQVFWERVRSLLALCATCKAMRRMVLTEAWENYVMCRMSRRLEPRIGTKLLSQCAILVENAHLAACVRTLVVDFVDGTDAVMKLFVECLAVLPNLHTLEIVSMRKDESVQSITVALERVKPQLQVRTLVLPPTAHWLLRYCPNVEDLTCCATAPDEAFVGSLVVGRLTLLTKLAVSYPGDTDIWPKVAEACPGIHELSIVHTNDTANKGKSSLYTSKQFISAFGNPSTIRLVYHLSQNETVVRMLAGSYRNCMTWGSEYLWKRVKDTAISQLKESSWAGGPKKLKTIVVFPALRAGAVLEPDSVVEEIVVCS